MITRSDDTTSPPTGEDATSAVSIDGLTMSYGGTAAVSDLRLSVERGEMLVLLGPSGCGKTSTMRSIVGLETPDSGTIRIDGRTMFDSASGVNLPPHRRGVGMVFQSYAIWPHKTVFENVTFPLRMQRVDKRQHRTLGNEALELVGMAGFGSRPASRLSGGQMQRVALARSLVMRPTVLLLDEPLSNLDARLRDRLRFELKDLQARLELTTIYVTHDQSEALVLADRVAVMNKGVLVQVAPPKDAYTEPANKFVADFLGVSNILRGTVVQRDGEYLHVRCPEYDIDLLAMTRREIGGTVSVCIRPDSVRFVEKGAMDLCNAWDGVVHSVSFVGTHYRCVIESDVGPTLDVIVSARERMPERGESVTVHIPATEIRLLID